MGLSGLDRNGFPLDSWQQYFPAFSDHLLIITSIYIPANPKQASRGGSTLCFDQWQKVVSIRPHFPMVKHTPAKESKVHNGGGHTPVLIFASLGHFMCGEALSGHGIQGP